MTVIDPAQKKTLPPPPPPQAPTGKEPHQKVTIDLGYVPKAPPAKLDVAALFPPIPGPPSGTGLTELVFGAKTPEPKKLSDDALAEKTQKLMTLVQKNPGKATKADLELLHALVTEGAVRADRLLSAPADVSKLQNRELLETLMMFDAAKATGVPLTPTQQADYQRLEAEWQKRVKNDPTKALAAAQARRSELWKEAIPACTAAATEFLGTASVLSTTSGVVYDLHQGNYGDALLKLGKKAVLMTLKGSPPGVALSAANTAYKVAKCAVLLGALSDTNKEIDRHYETLNIQYGESKAAEAAKAKAK